MSAHNQHRLVILAVVTALACILLLVRLGYLQIWQGAELARASVAQRLERLTGGSGRGLIVDRLGRPLTSPGEVLAAGVFPNQVKDLRALLDACERLGADRQAVAMRVITGNGSPFWVSTGVDPSQTGQVAGLVLAPLVERYGPESLATHVTGYLRPADGVGMDGLERVYQEVLSMGEPGGVAAVVDGQAHLIPGLGFRMVPAQGQATVKTTIDRDVQWAVERTMDQHLIERGAVVVLDPANGDVLALASRPDFDPNRPGDFLYDEGRPFLNRALLAYPPGSVFKLVAATAALEEGLVSPSALFSCGGAVQVGNHVFHCAAEHGHGTLNLCGALAESCNVAFIELGAQLGRDMILKYAQSLGFGVSTGINLPGEAPGTFPTAGEVGPVATANLTIGQGTLLATPLQVARAYACVASGGYLPSIRLIKEVKDGDGKIIYAGDAPARKRVLTSETCAILRRALQAAVQEGTGQRAAVAGVPAGGKTGTAQREGAAAGMTMAAHAWFAGFASVENPHYVIVVFIEEGSSGPLRAAPVFRDIVARLSGGIND
ncbi:MAG TPA: penicillin-binding protein 2 [Firmicutes bacterium]|nr:penicillin-binding protein 2 [Bacillota bacterium]